MVNFLTLSPTLTLRHRLLSLPKISYEIVISDDKSGTANIYITDITSDATDNDAFKQDTSALFTFMQKSDEFIEDMKPKDGSLLIANLF